MTLNLTVEMPPSELEGFLRAVRGWERGRPEILLAIKANVGGMDSGSLAEIFNRLSPAIPLIAVMKPEAVVAVDPVDGVVTE